MVDRREIVAGSKARGVVRLPPSKSLTNRHLTLALLARRPTLLQRPLVADDTGHYLKALRQLGLAVSGTRQQMTVTASAVARSGQLYCGASGTMLRFVTAAVATVPGSWVVDGSDRLRQRPVGGLVAALRQLGCAVEFLARPGFAPLRVRGGALAGGRVTVEAGESSQYVSALMMAAVRAAGAVHLVIRDLVSAPYVHLTRQVLESWGVQVDVDDGGGVTVTPRRLDGGRFTIEGDASSACYFAAGAALAGGRIELLGLSSSSVQGDLAFLEILRSMGASYGWLGDVLEVGGGGRLRAVDVDMSNLPDQVPTLAALAPFAEGTTRIRNVAHVRSKESDRLAAIARGLQAAGVPVEERAGGLSIAGTWARAEPPDSPVVVDCADDHRIAMSLALLGLRRRGVFIDDPGVVAKSYPSYWRDFAACLEGDPG